MAVYTHLSAEALSALIGHYDVGELVSAKGIAEGVSNSNWLVEAAPDGEKRQQYILTMYEHRTEASDLPFFLGLLDHLSAKGAPVPRTIHDRDGAAFRLIDGKAVALIEFLPGISVSQPTVAQARSVGAALAQIHEASSDFTMKRANDMGLTTWRATLENCGEDGLASIDSALPQLAFEGIDRIERGWPKRLPQAVIHADLFPDNVLMRGSEVKGLIDFYFACNDIAAYDLAVTHAAWSFSGGKYQPDIGQALCAGYANKRSLSAQERVALPILAQGAAMRFLTSRADDWLNTPADALVTRKDPMEFAKRLSFYGKHGETVFSAAFD